jgi:hypothetical protein
MCCWRFRSTAAERAWLASHSVSSGPVITLVTIAISMSIVNSCWLMTPISKPIWITISSIMPRVFISEPMANAARQC